MKKEKCCNATSKDECVVFGRKGIVIIFNTKFPERYLHDKSLVGMSKEELKRALDKPFIVTRDLEIDIAYGPEKYHFVIPKGYDWNGANVPSFAWVIIGQQKEPRFKLASCVHDYMCEYKDVVGYNRYFSTLIFETLCEHFGKFNDFKRWAMFHSVDNFQKTQEWGKKKKCI